MLLKFNVFQNITSKNSAANTHTHTHTHKKKKKNTIFTNERIFTVERKLQ